MVLRLTCVGRDFRGGIRAVLPVRKPNGRKCSLTVVCPARRLILYTKCNTNRPKSAQYSDKFPKLKYIGFWPLCQWEALENDPAAFVAVTLRLAIPTKRSFACTYNKAELCCRRNAVKLGFLR